MKPSAATQAELALLTRLVQRADGAIDLAQAALLLAEPFYPALDIPFYISQIDKLADELRRRLHDVDPGPAGTEARARRLLRLLYDEQGYGGATTDYYDPRNSFLNEVVDRKRGIPISLATMILSVGQRAGVAASGVSFPGHFLVRLETDGDPLLIDPFAGTLLTREDLAALHARHTGHPGDPPASLLAPTTKPQLLLRTLNNLRRVFRDRGDAASLGAVLLRMSAIKSGDAEVEAELLALGQPAGEKAGKLLN